jgi:hypothetical protein
MVCGVFCTAVPALPGQPSPLSKPRGQQHREKQCQHHVDQSISAGPDVFQGIVREITREISHFVRGSLSSHEDWVNGLLALLWPHAVEALKKVTAERILPELEKSLQKLPFFSELHIIDWDFGQTPPQVEDISIYSKELQEIHGFQMDARVRFDSNVNCRLGFGSGAVGFSITMTKFWFDGVVCLVGKPLLKELPVVGGLQLFCLNDPDFGLTLGGVANALQHMPIIEDAMRKTLKRVIRSQVVLPNRLYVELAARKHEYDLATLQCPPPEGILKLQLLEAQGLPVHQPMMQRLFSRGSACNCNPYVTLKIGTVRHQSTTLENATNPRWNEVARLLVHNIRQNLRIKVYHSFSISEKRRLLLGFVKCPVQELLEQMQRHPDGVWLELTSPLTSDDPELRNEKLWVMMRLEYFTLLPLNDIKYIACDQAPYWLLDVTRSQVVSQRAGFEITAQCRDPGLHLQT